jgi:hypothetical protein
MSGHYLHYILPARANVPSACSLHLQYVSRLCRTPLTKTLLLWAIKVSTGPDRTPNVVVLTSRKVSLRLISKNVWPMFMSECVWLVDMSPRVWLVVMSEVVWLVVASENDSLASRS